MKLAEKQKCLWTNNAVHTRVTTIIHQFNTLIKRFIQIQSESLQGHIMFQKGERLASVKFAQYQGTDQFV